MAGNGVRQKARLSFLAEGYTMTTRWTKDEQARAAGQFAPAREGSPFRAIWHGIPHRDWPAWLGPDASCILADLQANPTGETARYYWEFDSISFLVAEKR